MWTILPISYFFFQETSMTIPIIPTLHSTSGLLVDKSDIVAYVIRHILTQSGKTSNMYFNDIVSFRTLEAQYGADLEEFKEMFSRMLNKVLRRYFPDGSVTVDVDATTPDLNGQYNMEIRALTTNTSNDILILTNAKVSIKDGNVININFTGAKI